MLAYRFIRLMLSGLIHIGTIEKHVDATLVAKTRAINGGFNN